MLERAEEVMITSPSVSIHVIARFKAEHSAGNAGCLRMTAVVRRWVLPSLAGHMAGMTASSGLIPDWSARSAGMSMTLQ